MTLPSHKHDTEVAKSAAYLTDEELKAVGAGLLEWMQDINWPVAQVLAPILTERADVVIGAIADVLRKDDAMWSFTVITYVIADADPLVREALIPELLIVAASGDDDGAAEAAFDVLAEVTG